MLNIIRNSIPLQYGFGTAYAVALNIYGNG